MASCTGPGVHTDAAPLCSAVAGKMAVATGGKNSTSHTRQPSDGRASGRLPVRAVRAVGAFLLLPLFLVSACGDTGTNARRDTEISAVAADAGGPYAALGEQPTITFDGGGSFDPENEIETYEWDFGDGELGEGQVVEHEYSGVVGAYTVVLTVRNELGTELDSDTTTARIRRHPNAAFEVENADELKIGTPVVFDASQSDDGDGLGFVAEYRWDFRYDGVQFNPTTVLSEAVTAYTYLAKGKHTVALVVLDDDGFESELSAKKIDVADSEGVIIIIE